MAIGLYKPGHGYWVRVLTAAMLGIVTLATAAWVASQMQLLINSLPPSAWQVTLENAQGTVEPGARVELLGPGPVGERPVLGTAEVASYDPANAYLVLRKAAMTVSEADPSQARHVAAPGGGGFAGSVRGVPRGVAAVEPLVAQGGAAAVVILLGAAMTYLLVGVRPRTVDFLIATDMEMKKVNWSTRKDIKGSTMVVIGTSFLIALALFMFDLFFQWIFRLIGVVAS